MIDGLTVADRKLLRECFGAPVATVGLRPPSPYDPRNHRDRCPNGHDKPQLYPDCGFCARKGKEGTNA